LAVLRTALRLCLLSGAGCQELKRLSSSSLSEPATEIALVDARRAGLLPAAASGASEELAAADTAGGREGGELGPRLPSRRGGGKQPGGGALRVCGVQCADRSRTTHGALRLLRPRLLLLLLLLPLLLLSLLRLLLPARLSGAPRKETRSVRLTNLPGFR
jgi:hypothetical protein